MEAVTTQQSSNNSNSNSYTPSDSSSPAHSGKSSSPPSPRSSTGSKAEEGEIMALPRLAPVVSPVVDLSIFAAVAASAPLMPLNKPPIPIRPPSSAEESLLANPMLKGADLDQISKLIKQRLAQYQRQGMIQGPYVSPQKRSVHNFCERRRRENIRQGFAMLQRKLIGLEGSGVNTSSSSNTAGSSRTGESQHHMSKMETLRRSVETVSRIREDTMALEDEVNLLRQIKEQLILKKREAKE